MRACCVAAPAVTEGVLDVSRGVEQGVQDGVGGSRGCTVEDGVGGSTPYTRYTLRVVFQPHVRFLCLLCVRYIFVALLLLLLLLL